jgi:uncharacterized protein
MSLVWAAITLGFLGSFHCIGMCGPIALALPVPNNSLSAKVSGALLYNLGRMITYALFGMIFGMLGKSIVIAGFQQILSMSLGIIILLLIFLPAQWLNRIKITSFIYPAIAKIKNSFSDQLKKKSFSALFIIGLLNGLLPCGLVYIGIAGAISTGDWLQGGIFMAMFGFGTLPAMFTIAMSANSISRKFREKINKAMPVFVAGIALLLIMRGLNLGIPYISPQLDNDKPECHKCCHK